MSLLSASISVSISMSVFISVSVFTPISVSVPTCDSISLSICSTIDYSLTAMANLISSAILSPVQAHPSETNMSECRPPKPKYYIPSIEL